MGLVGGADFDQFNAAGSHDIGDAEWSANLDQLTTGNQGASPAGQSRQAEHDGTGVIVDHCRRFSTG